MMQWQFESMGVNKGSLCLYQHQSVTLPEGKQNDNTNGINMAKLYQPVQMTYS